MVTTSEAPHAGTHGPCAPPLPAAWLASLTNEISLESTMPSPKNHVTPSLSPQQRRQLDARPWTDAEVEHALERLDDTGIGLLAAFGTAMVAAFEHGEWVVRASGLTVPARRLAEHYHLDHACPGTVRRCRLGLCCDAILIAAGLESVDDRRIRGMAGQLAPVDRALFNSREAGERAMLDARQKLVDDGMLGFVRSAHFRDRVTLTDAGRLRMNKAVYPAWASLARRQDDQQHACGGAHD